MSARVCLHTRTAAVAMTELVLFLKMKDENPNRNGLNSSNANECELAQLHSINSIGSYDKKVSVSENSLNK